MRRLNSRAENPAECDPPLLRSLDSHLARMVYTIYISLTKRRIVPLKLAGDYEDILHIMYSANY